MGAREDIVASFKYELQETPFDKITVAAICEGAGVSRKSFYTYFSDKVAIVEHLFDEHVVAPLRTLNASFDVEDLYAMMPIQQERIYQGIYREREYYYNLVHAIFGRDDVFLKVATRSLFDFNKQLFSRYRDFPSEWASEYTSYFFASSQAMLMQKWVYDGFAVSPHELAQLYNGLTAHYWEGMYEGRK